MVRLHALLLSSIVRCASQTSFLHQREFAPFKTQTDFVPLFTTGLSFFCSKSLPEIKILSNLSGNCTSNNTTETSSFSKEFVGNKDDAETSASAKEFVENSGDGDAENPTFAKECVEKGGDGDTETSSFVKEFVEKSGDGDAENPTFAKKCVEKKGDGDAENSTFVEAKECVENDADADAEPKSKMSDEDYMQPLPRKERIKRALGKLRKGPDGRYVNALEVVSDLDMLIAAYQSLKAQSRPTYLIEDSDDEDSMEGIKLERFKKLQKRLRNGTYRFGTINEADNRKYIEELDDFSTDED